MSTLGHLPVTTPPPSLLALGGLQAWTPSGGPTSQQQPLSDIKAGRRLVNQREKKKINFPILPLEVVS